jgi:ornithine cyclodeaminase
MKILILNHKDVEQLLPMSECISAMAEAFTALARGEAQQPLRTIFRPPEIKGVLAMMPTFRQSPSPLFGLKAICVFPGNAAIGKDAHQGGVILFDGTTGEPLALINASAITAIRTAAVSALATQLLAREDASDLAIIGAGVQARPHLSAINCVRQLKRIRIVSRSFESAQRFATEMQPQFPTLIEPVATVEAAVHGANIIVTATTSREPVLQREWILPGAHINAIGTYSPKARELDTQTVVDASLFVDRRESALNEAGDYLIPASEGVIGPEHIRADLGEVLIGVHAGRTSPEEITVFKSLGLALEDLAAAAHVYQKAQETKTGSWVEF